MSQSTVSAPLVGAAFVNQASPPSSSGSGTQKKPLDTFVPVEGGEEAVSATTVLVAAYLVMWAVVLGFLLLSFRRQRGLEARLGALEDALKEAEDPSPRPE